MSVGIGKGNHLQKVQWVRVPHFYVFAPNLVNSFLLISQKSFVYYPTYKGIKFNFG